MFDPGSVRFRGPLAGHVGGFWAELRQEGYAPFSSANLLRVASHFSRWLEDHRIGLDELREGHIESFMAHRRRRGYTQFLSPSALRPLIGYLRSIGVVVGASPVVETPIDRLVSEYREYLARQRCLSAGTIRGYSDSAWKFARAQFGTGSLRWNQLTPSDIADFVMQQSRRWSIGHCKHHVTSVRSLLRFLHLRGYLSRDLTGCVPAVAGWRLAWLPRGLRQDQVDHLTEQLRAESHRDAAIVHLLLRLGLRAGDVAALDLDDIDWRAGEISVCGKGKRESRLPLPHDVGRSIARYLRRGRPRAATRKLFLRSRAPYRALTSGGVKDAAVGVLRRAGISSGGVHVLRHTAATQMLRRGASLSEIAHVLRHRHVDTTAIYAKVDYTPLRTLVRPWPRGAA
jgi:site-specific recombinase XerD